MPWRETQPSFKKERIQNASIRLVTFSNYGTNENTLFLILITNPYTYIKVIYQNFNRNGTENFLYHPTTYYCCQ